MVRTAGLYPYFHQAVLVAIKIQISSAAELHSCFGIAFGVELDELHLVGGHIGKKGNEMAFGHGVMDGDELFVLNGFDGDGVFCVRVFGFKGRQGNAAAADGGCARCRRL